MKNNHRGAAMEMLAMAVGGLLPEGSSLLPTKPKEKTPEQIGNDMYRLMRAAEKRKAKAAKRIAK